MEVQAILDESGISQMAYRALFKALAKKSQNKLQRRSLLPKPSHVKAAYWHVNEEVFDKFGSPFHIEAMFLGKDGRKVQFNEHNNFFVDLEALQRYAVSFFDISREECGGVLKFVLKLNECEVLKNKKLERVTITLMNRALDPSITKEDPRYLSRKQHSNSRIISALHKSTILSFVEDEDGAIVIEGASLPISVIPSLSCTSLNSDPVGSVAVHAAASLYIISIVFCNSTLLIMYMTFDVIPV
ncbi:hypothetical protein L7F22_025500 [Adiantum nelumboides]|nr:hypothetical protein [Adiantum nelumboides]